MREAGWLSCVDLGKMLSFLEEKWSQRKSRLFLCACCRRIRHLLGSKPSSNAFDVLERYTQGEASSKELVAAHRAAVGAQKRAEEVQGSQQLVAGLSSGSARRAAWVSYYEAVAHRCAAVAIACATLKPTAETRRSAAEWARGAAANAELERQMAAGVLNPRRIADLRAHNAASRAEELAQCNILRDLFNPFRAVSVDPTWRSWNGATIVALAQSIYKEQTFEQLPILADALEEADCADARLLAHCRQPGEHVRGCWVVDLLLGKE